MLEVIIRIAEAVIDELKKKQVVKLPAHRGGYHGHLANLIQICKIKTNHKIPLLSLTKQ